MQFPHVISSEHVRAMRQRERSIALAGEPPTVERVPVPMLSPGQYPFPGAISSSVRTSTAFFPLDPRREYKRYDRRELLRRSRYLRNASGVVRALFEKPVKFACPNGLKASACTPDPNYNEAVDAYFEGWASAPIDVTGQLNFYDSVEMLAANVPCDGEHFPMRVRTLTGRPQLQFIFGHQIDDHVGNNDPITAQFRDGVLENSLGRALSYRVICNIGTTGLTTFRDVSAEDMMHVRDVKRQMFSRGVPWIYHGANSELDRLDQKALDMVARKLHLALAAVIKRNGNQSAGLGGKMTAEDIALLAAAANGQPVPPRAPEHTDASNVTWEMILGGGAVPILRENEELTMVDTDRSPESYILAGENLIREICTGYGVSLEFIWSMAALGGPGSRFILEDLNAFCAMLNGMNIRRYCQPVRSWVIADGIINGAIPEPKAGNWWDCIWTGPAKCTIDRGRDGALFLKLLEKGMLTLDEWWTMLGHDSRKMRKKRIHEIAEDLADCNRAGVPYHLYIAAAAGTPANPDATPILDPSGQQLPAVLAQAMEKDPALRDRLAALIGNAGLPSHD